MGQKRRLRTRRFPHRSQLPIPAPTIGSRWPRSYGPQLPDLAPAIGARSSGSIGQDGVTEAEMVAAGEARETDFNSRLAPGSSTAFRASIPSAEEKAVSDYRRMEGYSYLDDGLEGEDTWRTI